MFKLILLLRLILLGLSTPPNYDYYTKNEVVTFINSKLDTCSDKDGYSFYQISVNKHNQLIVYFTHKGPYNCKFEYRVYMKDIKKVEIVTDKSGRHCIRLVCKYKMCNILRQENIEGRHIYQYRQYTLPITFKSDNSQKLKDAFTYLLKISKFMRKKE